MAVVNAATSVINLSNLGPNSINYNGCAKGHPLQPVVHPLLSQWVPFLMADVPASFVLALEMSAMGA